MLKLEIDELIAADPQGGDAENQGGIGCPTHGQRPVPAFAVTVKRHPSFLLHDLNGQKKKDGANR